MCTRPFVFPTGRVLNLFDVSADQSCPHEARSAHLHARQLTFYTLGYISRGITLQGREERVSLNMLKRVLEITLSEVAQGITCQLCHQKYPLYQNIVNCFMTLEISD